MDGEENKELNNPNQNLNKEGENANPKDKTPEEIREENRQSIIDNIEKMESDADPKGEGNEEGEKKGEGDNGGKPGASEEADPNPSNPTENPTDKPNPADDPKAGKKTNQPADPDTDEAILASIGSDRGKARFQKLLTERKQYRDQVESFAKQVKDSGLDQEAFGNVLSIARLCSSSLPEEQMKGLELLENVRSSLYQSLGREAPGVDLLKDAPEDLRQKVESMAITRDDALAIMRAKRFEQQQAEAQKRQAEMQMSQAQFQQKIATFSKQVEQMFVAKSQELDFNEKMKRISEYFANRDNLMDFVKNTPPERWGAAMMWMYDNMGVVAKKPVTTTTPITSHQTRTIGNAVPGAMEGSPKSIEQRMKELGI